MMNCKYLKLPWVAITSLLMMIIVLGTGCGGGGGDAPATPPVVAEPETSPRVWTIAEILSEPPTGGAGGGARCGGELGFRRCICSSDVPSSVRYRPAVLECSGNAAAILSGRLYEIFSVVARDSQNRDRWPAAGSGFGGCSASLANSASPPNSCSAFKVQSRFTISAGTEIHCLGASGYSDLFEDVTRLTVKLTDEPNSNDDEIERYCLISGKLPLN